MPKNNENNENAASKRRLPPQRGQIKAKIMNQIVRKVEEAGRAMCGNEKVAEEETQPSQPHDT